MATNFEFEFPGVHTIVKERFPEPLQVSMQRAMACTCTRAAMHIRRQRWRLQNQKWSCFFRVRIKIQWKPLTWASFVLELGSWAYAWPGLSNFG